ncbi:MAG: phosphatase PAP2 family protein [Corynebacterium sp.]|nr:phosphatase PAP2 family protein [Corynebacterium sp.]
MTRLAIKKPLAAVLAAGVVCASTAQSPMVASAGELPTIPAVAPGQEEPVLHEGAPIPVRFGLGDYVGYISDLSSHPWGVYLDVISDFKNLKTNQAVMVSNLDQVVDINNNASPETIARAQSDALADQDGVFTAIIDAFGTENAEYLKTALAEHRLPKTSMLFNGGWFARAGGIASSTFVEKAIYKNSRPFVSAPERIKRYEVPGEEIYLSSKSFPSGHTNQATWVTTLLAAALPEYSEQLLARGSESGYNRMVLGVHYPLDIMGGRMTGTAAAADRWNDPKMRAAVTAAAEEIRAELAWRHSLNPQGVNAPYSTNPVGEYTERMSYGFEAIASTSEAMIVPQQAPDLLVNKFPELNWEQRRQILEQTATPSGMPLDVAGKASWERLNLAAAFAARYQLDDAGNVHVLSL